MTCVVGVAKPGCKPLQVELCEELTELEISKRNGGSRDGGGAGRGGWGGMDGARRIADMLSLVPTHVASLSLPLALRWYVGSAFYLLIHVQLLIH